ncbi:predicted protein [Histoplasma mississippiense (nom. inval.)]|uniref:predicted protein n=1 Tax=Ajellomyces capsulatus (strain NAm1 / WU24) TaxID=2059318 RepID=UPI000157BE11|nr:predicted protein [Histoplasma mississippiense (nom. inval.)]EDN06081.1 predicted protein [Histoplasma mississippiense (nom. inval.)]
MYPNIPYALLSAALIVLSTVHLILLTVHRPQPHRLPEISIFVLFVCVNAVVIGIGLSGLRRGDDSANQNPGRTTYERPPASIISRILFSVPCVAYETSVKGTAVVVSIDYAILAIAGLLFWGGIRGIPSQGPVIREVTIHAFLVIVTAGFAAGGLVYDWPFWIQCLYGSKYLRSLRRDGLDSRPENESFQPGVPGCVEGTGKLASITWSASAIYKPSLKMLHRSLVALFEIQAAHPRTGKLLEASLSDLMSSWAGVAMAFEAGYIRDVMRFSRSCPLSSGHLHIIDERTSIPRAVTLSFYGSHTRTMTIPFEALNTWPGRIIQGQNTRQSSGGQCTYAWRLPSFISILAIIPAVESHTEKLVVRLDASTSQKRRTLEYTNSYFRHGSKQSDSGFERYMMDKDLTSGWKLRKRASTQAIRENAEPNKRTDRSQDQDDDQIRAHLLNEIRGKSQTKEGYVEKKVRQRLKLYCCGSNRRHDAQTNNQTRAVPATLSQAIKIDEDPETETDSVLYMLPHSKLKRKLREQQQKRQTWVNRAIKCCSCEVTGSAVNKCACGHESPIPSARDSQPHLQPASEDIAMEISLVVRPARHVKCDEAAPACRNCIKRDLYCDGARLYRFVNPGSVKGEYKAFRGKTGHQLQMTVSPAHTHRHIRIQLPPAYVPLQSGIHASTESLAMDIEPINPTAGDGKPPLQSTLNDDARDLESHSSSYNPYSIDEADWYSEYPNIRGDVFHGNEEVPLTFIVCISEPVLQEQLKYLKAHTSHLHFVFGAFSENSFDGPLALPYALCLFKILRQHPGQQLSEKRLDDTIQFLSIRLRGLLSTPLFNTGRGRISRVSLLFRRQVFHKRPPRLLWPEESWKRSTVWGFTLDGNLTVTLFLDGQYRFKVPDEVWSGFSSLDSGIADVAVIFGVG